MKGSENIWTEGSGEVQGSSKVIPRIVRRQRWWKASSFLWCLCSSVQNSEAYSSTCFQSWRTHFQEQIVLNLYDSVGHYQVLGIDTANTRFWGGGIGYWNRYHLMLDTATWPGSIFAFVQHLSHLNTCSRTKELVSKRRSL